MQTIWNSFYTMPLGWHSLSNCREPDQQKIKVTELEYIFCQTSLVEFVKEYFVMRGIKLNLYYLQLFASWIRTLFLNISQT